MPHRDCRRVPVSVEIKVFRLKTRCSSRQSGREQGGLASPAALEFWSLLDSVECKLSIQSCVFHSLYHNIYIYNKRDAEQYESVITAYGLSRALLAFISQT